VRSNVSEFVQRAGTTCCVLVVNPFLVSLVCNGELSEAGFSVALGWRTGPESRPPRTAAVTNSGVTHESGQV